MHIFEQGDRCY